MKKTDRYHRWVEWSEEDETYRGKCPDLIRGGVHDDDPVKSAEVVEDAINDVGRDYEKAGKWPPVRVMPRCRVF